MRHVIAAALTLAAISAASAASAQVLVSGDNPAATVFNAPLSSQWLLDGTNTALSFRTTKANERVELSFSGLCGVRQTGNNNDQGSQATTTYVQAIFNIDGQGALEGGIANQLCLNTLEPSFGGAIQQSGAITRLSVNVPQAGLHSVGVTIYGYLDQNGSTLSPFLAQTHISVTH